MQCDMNQFHQAPPFLEDLDINMDIQDHIEIPRQELEDSGCQGCRGNDEIEEDFGLDSTFLSNMDFNQSIAPFNFEEDLEMQENDGFETFYFGNQTLPNNKQAINSQEDHSAFEDPLEI